MIIRVEGEVVKLEGLFNFLSDIGYKETIPFDKEVSDPLYVFTDSKFCRQLPKERPANITLNVEDDAETIHGVVDHIGYTNYLTERLMGKHSIDYSLLLKDYDTNEFFNWSDTSLTMKDLNVEFNPKIDYSSLLREKNKYKVTCKGVEIDVYDVLKAFEVTCPALQHSIKKLLKAGKRGHKDLVTDLNEAIDAINRAKQLWEEK